MHNKKYVFIFIVLVLSVMNSESFAACSNPAGVEGEQIYNADHNTMQYCDGTDWTAMRGDDLGNHTATTALDLATNKITNLGTPTAAADAATKAYVDANAGLSVETDPQVAAVTNGQWCRGTGSAITCDQAAPSGDNLGAGGTTSGNVYATGQNIGRDGGDRLSFINNARIEFDVNGIEEMRLTPSALDLNGNDLTDISTVQATAYFHLSDERLKDNIETISGLDLISQLRGVTYDWKETGLPAAGVIAQEVEKVIPSAVSTNEETGLKSVEYDQLIAPLIEAVKELKAENQSLRARVDALE